MHGPLISLVLLHLQLESLRYLIFLGFVHFINFSFPLGKSQARICCKMLDRVVTLLHLRLSLLLRIGIRSREITLRI